MTTRVGLSSTVIEPTLSSYARDGIGVYTRHLARLLPEMDCAIKPYCFPEGLGRTERGQTVGQPLPWPYGVQVLASAAGREVKLREQVDLFHVTDFRVVRFDVPVVATLHDAIPLQFPEWSPGRLSNIKARLRSYGARHAEQVIALSQSAVPDLVRFFKVDERRITVIPCGVDAHWFTAPDPDAVRATLGNFGLLPDYFLFVGTVQPRKNVARIIEAYCRLPARLRAAHPLVIVGRRGWQCGDVDVALAAAQARKANVQWLQHVESDADLRNLYAGACAFVFPSLYEGFGIPVLEAFAAGVPVLTSTLSSLPEVAGDAALTLDPLDVAALAAGMEALAKEGPLRATCIERGRQRAATFSWQRTAALTAELYRTVR